MSLTQNLLPDTPTPLSSSQPPPSGRPAGVGRRRLVQAGAGIAVVAVWLVSSSLLGLGLVSVVLLGVLLLAAFQTLVRRRPLRTLLARDTASFARGWAGKLLVAAVLIAIPATMVLLSLSGGRYGRYADDSWKALLMLVVLAGSYLATRRLVLTVLIGAVTVALVSWVLAPNLADARNGDPTVLAHLDQQAGWGMLAGYHDVAVAEIDLDAAQPVRLAGIGADDTTPMEVGSMTKAMTGLVIADAVRRGEIRMDAPVATYLPQLKGSPAGTATMHELVTHTSGYAEFGAATLRRAAWKAPLGQNFFTADSAQMTEEARAPDAEWPWRLRVLHPGFGHCRPGRRGGSPHELPGPDAHPAVRAARHVPHRHRGRPRTRRRRTSRRPVSRSSHGSWTPTPPALPPSPPPETSRSSPPHSSTGPPPAWPPWSPRPPPTSRTPASVTSGRPPPGRPVRPSPHHAGQTGGYASYLGLDRPRHKAVIVLSDVANDASDLGTQLLADRTRRNVMNSTDHSQSAPAPSAGWRRSPAREPRPPRLDRGRLVGHRARRRSAPRRRPVHPGRGERHHRRGPVRIRAGLGDAGRALGAVHRPATAMGRGSRPVHGTGRSSPGGVRLLGAARCSAGCGPPPCWRWRSG